MNRKIVLRILVFLASLTLLYIVLLTSFKIPYNQDSIYIDNFQRNGAYRELGEDYVNNVYINLRAYLDDDYFAYEKTQLLSEFDQDETSHLQDVKKLMDWFRILYYIAIIAFIASLTAVLKLAPNWKKTLGKVFLWSGGSALCLILLIWVFSIFNFGAFWDFFHEVLFPQGNWQFPTSSLLITLFPQYFFESFARIFITIVSFLSVVLVGIGLYLETN